MPCSTGNKTHNKADTVTGNKIGTTTDNGIKKITGNGTCKDIPPPTDLNFIY